MPRRTLILATLLVPLLSATLLLLAKDTDPNEACAAADKSWNEHSYKDALTSYRAVLTTAPQYPERLRLEYRITACLALLQQWDEADQALATSLGATDLPALWRFRTLALRGNLYREWPHYVYKNDEKTVRGRYLDEATYTSTSTEDFEKSRNDLEAAKDLSYALAADATLDDKTRKVVRREIIDVNDALATVLLNHWDAEQVKRAHAGFDQLAERYDRTWPVPVRVRFLQDEVATFDDSPNHDEAAEAQVHKAMQWRARFLPLAPEERPTWYTDPAEILRKAVATWPKARIAPDAQYALCQVLTERSDFPGAITECERLVELFPDHKWVSDAKAMVQDIRRPAIVLAGAPAAVPGTRPQLGVNTRNVKTVTLTAWRINLGAVLDRLDDLADLDDSVENLSAWLSRQGAGHREAQAGTWTLETGDDGRHQPAAASTTCPFDAAGAYVVEAQANGVTAYTLVNVTNLTAVVRADRTGTWVYAAASDTGKPAVAAQVRVREAIQPNRRWECKVSRGETDANGLFQTAHHRLRKDWGNTVNAVAWKDGHYAFTPGFWSNPRASDRENETLSVFVLTDRPVYRPAQAVHFQFFVKRRGVGEEFRAAARATADVVITDPKGKKIFSKRMTTDEFGSAGDTVLLEKGCPLGQYRIALDWGRHRFSYTTNSTWFRVEEYKKPEYEVTVAPDKEQSRLGEPVTVLINARYYFGAPVTEAEVKYRVFRTLYNHVYNPRSEYDWYYGSGYEWAWRWQPRRGGEELVGEGTLKTDAEGNARVTVETAKAAKDFPKDDHQYRVDAEVRDASRRVINGSGSVKVTRQEYYTILSARRGFAMPGDNVEVEVTTQTANGTGRPISGTLMVSRVTQGAKPEEPTLTKLTDEALATDAEGRAFWRWTPDSEGLFRISHTSRDAWGQEVVGSVDLWVAGKDFKGAQFSLRDVEVITDKRTYAEGDVAHLLITANYPDAAVLLTQEAADEITDVRVVSLPNRTAVLDLPITPGHSPNFFLRAVLVRNRNIFQDQREVFVPPAKEFLEVAVTPSKTRYLPGEKATLKVKATHQGKPVRALFALSVFDKSILYIQPEIAGDIRTHFYGGRRGMQTQLSGSSDFQFHSGATDANTYTEYKRHGMPGFWWGGRDRGRLRRGLVAQGEAGGDDSFGLEENSRQKEAKGDFDGFAGGKGGGGAVERLERGRADEPAGKPGAPPPGSVALPAASGATPAAPAVEPVVRKEFADSAYWNGAVVTGDDGTAEVEYTCPDNLTAWAVRAAGVTPAAHVGRASAEVVTTKNLLVRLQAPRFFVERDEVLLSANIHNYLESDKEVTCEIKLPAGILEAVAGAKLSVKVNVAKKGEARVDWLVHAQKEGMAEILVKALTDEESDAVKMSFPVLVHGLEKFIARSAVLRGATESATLELDVPEARRQDASRLRIQVSPSVAGAVIEALPYLLDYPYGCVEQTMSRFMPAVVVQKTLKDLGLSLEQVGAARHRFYADAGLDRHPWAHRDPVFDTATLNQIVAAGLDRLYSFQHGDGGWGWWQGGDSDPYMSAYVVLGLQRAVDAGIAVDKGRLDRAYAFLKSRIDETKDKDVQPNRSVMLAYALSQRGSVPKGVLEHLYGEREQLSGYGKALLAMTLHRSGEGKGAGVLLRNLNDFLETDEKAGTCRWHVPTQTGWWFWYNDEVEAQAAILQAFVLITPADERIPKMAKWLLENREGGRWKSTKDTAWSILALCDYARAAAELDPEMDVTVDFDGVAKKVFHITRDNMFAFDDVLEVRGDAIDTGKRKLTVSRAGKGNAYVAAHLTYFSLEEDIPPAASGIEVAREYSKLIPKPVTKTVNGKEMTELTWEKVPLKPGDPVVSGDQIEVKLRIKSDNEYEYLVFEDPKPAGCEPVELRSGHVYGLAQNMELRDEKVVFFVGWLTQGEHSMSYKLRAEIPGKFHVLPTAGYAMYAPRVRATSAEWRLTIEDRK